MPLSVETLTPASNDKEVQDAISHSIEQCMREGGRAQKECAGMTYGIAREKTGKELGYGGQR